MATVESTKAAVQNGGSSLVPADRLSSLLSRMDIKKRFTDILGKKSPGFISSIMSVVNSSTNLKAVDPNSILASAVVAATLDLPINSNLGFAYIVPYKGKAQFQMGYKGFIQLAIRSGQYKTIHAAEVYQDELAEWNPIKGKFATNPVNQWKQREAGESDKIVGYLAFFELINGFEKYIYMTKAQVTRHAQRYSQSYSSDNGRWKLDFPAMALKTVLKLLLSKYGILSIEMQKAIQADQSVVTGIDPEKQTMDYQDAELGGDPPAESEPKKTDEPVIEMDGPKEDLL